MNETFCSLAACCEKAFTSFYSDAFIELAKPNFSRHVSIIFSASLATAASSKQQQHSVNNITRL